MPEASLAAARRPLDDVGDEVLQQSRHGIPLPIVARGRPIFTVHLEAFTDDEPLRTRIHDVLTALPAEVQRDFLDDPRFRIAKETFVPGKGWTLWMESPGAVGHVSRCVLLRARLGECSTAFAHYVIAHEFAHAFLRNGGWGAITDKEEAADALAASWGFHRPAGGRW